MEMSLNGISVYMPDPNNVEIIRNNQIELK